MTLKKTLKLIARRKAQSSLEYFILFSIIAILTLACISSWPKVRSAGEAFFQEAARRIVQ